MGGFREAIGQDMSHEEDGTEVMMRFLILVDYREQLWLKTDHREQSVDTKRLAEQLRALGADVEVLQFADLDVATRNHRGSFVLYQSAEDPCLHYKSFVEDRLLALELAGAVLVPPFHFFRAHHNKVFMELLRDLSPLSEIKSPKAYSFGTFEEYEKRQMRAPGQWVFKLSEGAQSKHVRLLTSDREKRCVPKKCSRSFNLWYWIANKVKPYLGGPYPDYRPKSQHRRKFIVQEFVSGLKGDFKIVVVGDKYYVLERRTRPNDFRASGSGRFSFPVECDDILDFSRTVYGSFDVPFLGLDVAFDTRRGRISLLEFQFVHIGTYTLESSPHYFQWDQSSESWNRYEGRSDLEVEVAAAAVEYARRRQ